MIRINLLPQKKGRGGASGENQTWLALVLVAMALEVVGALVLYSFKQEELDGWQKKNAQVTDQINQSRAKVKDHKNVKARLKILRAREDAIAKLQSARTGPTAVLLEIARLLTRGRGPSIAPEKLAEIQRENPLAMYNPNWDSRQLWLTKFVEAQRTVKLEGLARDGEDVSELARRMGLSSYFHDVKLLPAARKKAGKDGFEWVDFQLEARVRY